jgi:flagellar motor protein MotB
MPPNSTYPLAPAVKPSHDMDDSLQFLWAISYSDVLMVLLTFFIIFYQFSESMVPSPLQKVVLDLKKVANAVETSGSRGIPVGGQPETTKENITYFALDAVKSKLNPEKSQLSEVDYRNGIVVNLSDNIYEPAKFAANPVVRGEIEKVLETLKPYSDRIALTFIGHTDESPVAKIGNKIIDSNLVLSNLRAAKAVEVAVANGFNPRWVAAQGVAEFTRNSRTLSIQVLERTKP